MNAGRRSVVALLLAVPTLVAAQVPRQPNPPGRPPVVVTDSSKLDSTARFSSADSVMAALLNKPGYMVTRYEGDVVTFDAVSKALAIAASATQKAIVEREGLRVHTDSMIVYNDATGHVNVSGRYEIVPGAGQSPIAGSGTARYDLAERSGRLTNATVTVEEAGERWFIRSEIGKTALGDSARGIQPRFYGIGGSITSCEDSIPDYHFRLREIKRTSRTLAARPAVLYIKDIPVMWLPFFFQDIRPGRRSGILPPRFGASDIVRNNPGYRRHIENIGYYWAFSDYADFAMWASWRSSAGGDEIDPGFYEVNGEWKYNWLSRFVRGRFATSYQQERGGDSRHALSWDHSQRLGQNRNFAANANYTSSTTLQRRNTFSPAAAMATIASAFTFSDKLGPASLQLGGRQTQYPGRSQLDRTLPTLTLTTPPVELAKWLVWSPNFSYTENASLKIDQPSTFMTKLVVDANGQFIRADTLRRDRYDRTITFDSPLRIFGMDFANGVRIRDQLADYPEEVEVYPDADSSRRELRVFPRTYRTDVSWDPSFSLPPFFQNRFKLTPSVSLQNVDPGPFWVRSEVSGGRFVHQSKRLSYGLAAAPTIFGIWPGFGPFQRFRHSVSPGFSYAYAPAARVSDEYLEAIGTRKQGYRGSYPQSIVSMTLSQNIEAKARVPLDSGRADGGQKLTILSTQFTSLSYDFERARVTGSRLAGLTTENFGTSLRSDLLPGFDLNLNYSLFEGSTISDTARFDPVLTTLSSRISLRPGQNPFTVITRLFGRAVPDQSPSPHAATGASPRDDALTREMASQPVAGQASRGTQFVVRQDKGWEASFNFSLSRPRPLRGDRVIQYDPKIRCEAFRILNPFAYQECLRSPSLAQPFDATTAGAPAVQMPRQSSLGGDMRFPLTQKWAAAWTTNYDFEESKFAAHVVSLQRDMHDWRAIFAFTHAPNGNFAFNFFIALKPQPELKFDYSRATMRSR